MKLDENSALDDCKASSATPPFYYNLPRHSPKGPHLLPVDTVVQALKNVGYNASRTHFDREAVRTNANAQQLMEVIKNCFLVK